MNVEISPVGKQGFTPYPMPRSSERGLIPCSRPIEKRAAIIFPKEQLIGLSVAEIVDLADRLFAQIREEEPNLTIFDLMEKAAGQLPQKIPHEAQKKAMQAIASEDVGTKALGKKTLIFLNTRSLLTVVRSFYAAEIDSPEDRDEMLASTIAYVMGKINAGMTINSAVARRINGTAKDGIVGFFRKKYDMPVGLIRNPQNRLFALTRVAEFWNEFPSGDSPSGDSIENLANELSEGTGAKKEEILNWLMFSNADRKAEKERMCPGQGSNTHFGSKAFWLQELQEQMEEALGTLRENERRILELRFGLGENVKKRTLEEIGKELGGVTRERIRQIEARALRKLRHPSRSGDLRDFLGDYD